MGFLSQGVLKNAQETGGIPVTIVVSDDGILHLSPPAPSPDLQVQASPPDSSLDNIAFFSDDRNMTYPGGKNAPGVYQTIINLMPPHEVYIEPFLGSGAIMRMKRPARRNIGIDLDPQVIGQWQDPIANHDDSAGSIGINDDTAAADKRNAPVCTVINGDAFAFLTSYHFTGGELIYCDPPYLPETRSRADYYHHELTRADHQKLLGILTALPCMVMLSGYDSPLYTNALKHWQRISYQTMTRGGRVATEWLWFNYPKPTALHDYRYSGEDFRERERIKRKKQRWVRRLKTMPTLERYALLSAIREVWTPAVSPDIPIPADTTEISPLQK
jgi:DNA adenine methylase